MILLILLSIEIHISPNPITGTKGERIPFNVIIVDEEGKTVRAEYKLNVIPENLGKIRGNNFIPDKPGKGIIKCRAKIEREIVRGYAYVNIRKRKKAAKITPPSGILNPGEDIKFNVLEGKVKRWKVIPAKLGNVNNGHFTARQPGRGRIVAVLDNGRVISAYLVVKGIIKPVKIKPDFIRIKVGEKVNLNIREEHKEKIEWMVEPDDIGRIDRNGNFIATKPGRALVTATITENGVKRTGKSIIIISGKIRVNIIPGEVKLKPGEKIKFRVRTEEDTDMSNIPVKWKVIPDKCGIISKDGTFRAGKHPVKGRVVAIIPRRFGGGVGSAEILIRPLDREKIKVLPEIIRISTDEDFNFKVKNREIPVTWKVVPKDLGVISKDGKFKPERTGVGYIIAEPAGNLNYKPGRSFILVGKENVEIVAPNRSIIEGFSTPVKIETKITDYKVMWKVVPSWAGTITEQGKFTASSLPEGRSKQTVSIYAILIKKHNVVGWGRTFIRVLERR